VLHKSPNDLDKNYFSISTIEVAIELTC